MEGRTDVDKYPASCRAMLDYVVAPQGPAIARSGTAFVASVYDDSKISALIPFAISEEASQVVELADERARFFTEDGGLLTKAPVASVMITTAPFAFTSALLTADGGAVGAQVALSGLPDAYNLNGVVGNITAKAGDDYTIDTAWPLGQPSVNPHVALVYHIVSPYDESQVSTVRDLEDLDVIYTMHPDVPQQKLSHANTYSWAFSAIAFVDGPYLDTNTTTTTLTPSANTGAITLTASSIVGINNGAGFKNTDIGRLVRMKQGTKWSWLKITAWTSTTVVSATVMGANLAATAAVTTWRLGYWSDTTGYPNCAVFYQDRLWYGGCKAYPDLFVSSNTGDYGNMQQTDVDGVVLATHSIVGRINSRKLSSIRWMAANDKGLAIGTGSGEFVITSSDGPGKTLDPTKPLLAVPAGNRGSYNMDALAFGSTILFGQRFGRTLREFAFVFEVDGYKAPSMNLLSSHLGMSPFTKMVYTAEPHSIVWILRKNGTIVGMTYNRDENVVAWHRHSFSGAFVESICAIPAHDQLQDALWIIAKRTIAGKTRRYVERLTRFWDFDMTVDQAHYVDCAIRYSGAPTNVINGGQHLEGEPVYGLVDNNPIGPLVFTNGSLTLDAMYSKVILGLGFDADVETSRLENGAQDGTAQGKVKRIHNISMEVWQSFGGLVGTWDADQQRVVFNPVEYPGDPNALETVTLFDGIIGPITPAPGYEKRGSLSFRRPKESPLPFHVTALMPQLDTQDR